jgi:superfamily II DNA or RNA helicase
MAPPSFDDLAHDRLVMSDAEIRRNVGEASFDRSLSYVSRGAVQLLQVNEGIDGLVVALVSGTQSQPYEVEIAQFDEPPSWEGFCSCPVGYNCKHVAAVLLTLVKTRLSTLQSNWAQSLNSFREVADGSHFAAESDVALQFELKSSGSSTPRLIMRPVIRGNSGRWVRSGISWSSLHFVRYGRRHVDEDQIRLLAEIRALNNANGSSWAYGSREANIQLDTFPSPRIWDVLRDAHRQGLALIDSSRDQKPVELSPTAATPSLDLAATDMQLAFHPHIVLDDEDISMEHSMMLGTPAHGVAWFTPATPGSREVTRIALAQLSRVLPRGAARLFEGSGGFAVPRADIEKFQRDFYADVRRNVLLTSRDGSFDLPSIITQLRLTCEYVPHQGLDLEWTWNYLIGDVQTSRTLWPSTSGESRDTASEDWILGLVTQQLKDCVGFEQLLESRPSGERLAERCLLTGLDVVNFVNHILPTLREIGGVDIVETNPLPLFNEATLAPVISMSGSPGSSTDWFDLAITVTVGDEEVPFRELFVALSEDKKQLLLSSGTYFSLERPELHQLYRLIVEARSLVESHGDVLRLSRFQSSWWEELVNLGIVSQQAEQWAKSVRGLHMTTRVAKRRRPTSLRAKLRPYQQAGFEWLAFLYEHDLGGVLADDMGLGKTIQALALICYAREANPDAPPFLIVVPTSVVGNWVSECQRFCPSLTTVAITETAARRQGGDNVAALRSGADIVVTSYTLFRLEYESYETLDWAGLLLDEAQYVKNRNAKAYLCARRLKAPFKLAITGTPMENNLMELWSMFSITAPGLFPDPHRFAKYYRTPIERHADAQLLDQLRRRIKPLLLRRTKDEVAKDLPEKLEQVLELNLNSQHDRVYQTHLHRERQKVLGLLGDVQKNRFKIFASLTLLRQLSIDPSLIDPKYSKIPSTKLDALMEQVVDIVAEGHRALVFSQFTTFLGRVRERLDAEGIEYCYLDGSTRNRPKVVAGFKEGSAPLFLISLKAGGVGLNLAEADYCILLDPWWNPAAEAQAVDRAHRIGQTKKVMVYRLVSKGTIEEKVMAMKDKKLALFSSVLDGAGAGRSSLSATDIRELLD